MSTLTCTVKEDAADSPNKLHIFCTLIYKSAFIRYILHGGEYGTLIQLCCYLLKLWYSLTCDVCIIYIWRIYTLYNIRLITLLYVLLYKCIFLFIYAYVCKLLIHKWLQCYIMQTFCTRHYAWETLPCQLKLCGIWVIERSFFAVYNNCVFLCEWEVMGSPQEPEPRCDCYLWTSYSSAPAN